MSKLAINPEGNALVVWLGLIAFGFMYFVWILIARQAFEQLQNSVGNLKKSILLQSVLFIYLKVL